MDTLCGSWLIIKKHRKHELQSFLFLFILKQEEKKKKDPCTAMKLTAPFKQTHETRNTLDLAPKANSFVCL